MTKTFHLRGTCVRCGRQEEVTLQVGRQSLPDHMHVICLPCGLPTLYVKFPVEDDNESADESADAERAQEHADHLRELAAEREMLQAQMPVVNVEEEAPNG